MRLDHKCVQEEIIKSHENRIKVLEEDKVETKVYVKLIREDIQDMKADLKEFSKSPENQTEKANKLWASVANKLIEVLGNAIVILGAIVGAAKILGK